MSAAEKLGALDEEMTAGPWRYEDERSPTKWPGLHSETGTVLSIGHDYYKPDPRSLAALRNALPQIVAVVEAAELKPNYVYVGIPMEDGRPSGRVRYPLVEALAALDEALSPPTGGSP